MGENKYDFPRIIVINYIGIATPGYWFYRRGVCFINYATIPAQTISHRIIAEESRWMYFLGTAMNWNFHIHFILSLNSKYKQYCCDIRKCLIIYTTVEKNYCWKAMQTIFSQIWTNIGIIILMVRVSIINVRTTFIKCKFLTNRKSQIICQGCQKTSNAKVNKFKVLNYVDTVYMFQ